jgi:hypothetical protein
MVKACRGNNILLRYCDGNERIVPFIGDNDKDGRSRTWLYCLLGSVVSRSELGPLAFAMCPRGVTGGWYAGGQGSRKHFEQDVLCNVFQRHDPARAADASCMVEIVGVFVVNESE